MVNRRIAHYELLELLGIGGAAEVHRVLDLTDRRELALKLLSERAEPEMVLRFIREGRALYEMDHPHILRVFDAGEDRGQRYIAMELMAGASLKERLDHGALPWREAVSIARQVAEGLAYAHARGIVHRDLKPGNIMFNAEGSAKLADFGLAHLDDLSAMTRTGTVMGTVFYLSPEQAVGRHVDARSDLFALGAVLYEMLTGEPPFGGPSAVAIIYKILNQEHTPLRERDPSLPVALARVVDRLLEKDLDLRYQQAEQVAAALAALEQAEGDASSAIIDLEGEAEPARSEVVPLVGRQTELETLAAAMQASASGMGQTFMLAGEAGIGKTRLVQELRRVAAQQNVLLLQGDCLYVDAPNPYAPFAEMLSAYVRQAIVDAEANDPQAVALGQALADARALLLGDGSSDHLQWLNQSSPQEAQTLAFELVTRLWELVSRERPLILVLDDMHWASATTLQLFHHLARSLRGARLLLMGTYRPEDVLGDEDGAHALVETMRRMSREGLYQELRLEPLDEAASAELMQAELRQTDLPEALLGKVAAQTEGNPFALLETLRLMREQGLLALVQGAWAVTAATDDLALPTSVADVVLRRVDQLEREDRELLEWAAVLGQRFDVELLAEMAEQKRFRLVRRLSQLERTSGLIDADEQGFYFHHARIRQVLYQAMPAYLRQESHLMVGELLEEQYGETLGVHVYELAHHYAAGKDAKRGFRYSQQAAAFAQSSWALAESLAYTRLALSLIDEAGLGADQAPQRLSLMHQQADLCLTTGAMQEAAQSYQDALPLAEALADQAIAADLWHGLASVAARQGQWEQAIEHDLRSLQLGQALADAARQAQALLSMGFVDFEQGAWVSAQQRLEQASALAQQAELPLLQARIWGNSAILRDARGQKEEAVQFYRQSIATFGRLERELDMARGLNNLGFAHHGLGQYEQALLCYEQALEIVQRRGDVREQAMAYLHLAETRLQLGDLAATRTACTEASRRFERIGFELGSADVDRVYAGIARAEGRQAVAERYLRGALAIYEAFGDQLNLAETRAELAELLAASGQVQDASAELHRSRIIYDGLLGQQEPPRDPS